MSCGGCRVETTDSNVKVEEGGKKANFLNQARATFSRTRVDGCLKQQSIAADFVVSKKGVGDVIVELKGTDVNHAMEQIFATARFMFSCTEKRGPIAGLVVCSQYPRIDTKVQRLKLQFAKEFKSPIHVVTRNENYDFEQVLLFEGPL